jgi:ribosomal protein L24
MFPEEDETEEDLCALAAAYEDAGREYSRAAREEQSVAPVRPAPAPTVSAPPVVADHTLVPDTWVIPKHGLHKGRLSLVLTKRKLLAAPISLVETVGMGLMTHQQFNKCIEVTQSTDMLREKYTVVQPPTPAQLAPFLEDDHPALEKIRFRGHSPALAEGDRVVVVAGPHQGETGFIVVLREVPVDRQRVKYAKIVKVYNGVDIVKKGDTGLYVRVAHLERHGLDVPCAIVVQDRVRVVSGVLFRGATGRVIDNSNGILTVVADKSLELTGATTQSEMSDRQVFQTSIRYVNRDYHCGDLVRVRTGKHKGRVGLIVATFTGGSFEVFDVSTCFLNLFPLY